MGTSLEGEIRETTLIPCPSTAAPSLQPPAWHQGGDVLEIITQQRGNVFPAWHGIVVACLGELVMGRGGEITSLVLISMDETAQRALGLREDTHPTQTARRGRGESSSF